MGNSQRIAIVMGSPRDSEKMAPASRLLEQCGIQHDFFVMSAHRSPGLVAAFARSARERGYAVVIAGAGMAAHLAGAIAAHCTLPVIGVPLSGGAIGGIDALYATVQMPTGIPVATVAIDGAANAALLAVQILAIGNPELVAFLDEQRRDQIPPETDSAAAALGLSELLGRPQERANDD